MFKLLTETEKQKVTHEYLMRRTIVMLCAFILVFVIGIIGLFPSYTLSNIRYTEALERTRVVGSAQQRNDDLALQVWLKEINYRLNILSPALDTDRPSILIEQILGQKGAAIIITSFSLVKAKDKVSISVNGVAADRQSLIVFENRVNALEIFSKIVSPISNLAKDKDIDFRIQLMPL